MNNYYVYLHRRLSDNEPFYVGKGQNKRAYVKSHRSLFWKRIVNKHGYLIEFLEKGLTEEDSLNREIFWIKHFGRLDKSQGSLINFTDGGEGTSGAIVKQHVKIAVAKANKNRITGVNQKKVGNMYKGKTGVLHNRSKSVIHLETGEVYGSMSEASRQTGVAISSVHWSVRNNKPIFNMHFQIAH